MEQWRKDLADVQEKAGYLPLLRSLAQSHTCPFFWYDDSLPVGNSILHSGTITVINTGSSTMAISAHHVYAKYLEDRETLPHVKCQFGSATVVPEDHVISEDVSLDIVTFRLSSVLVAATGVTVHNPSNWPPLRLKESEIVIFGGYPGIRRSEGIGIVTNDFVSFMGRVTQTSDDHVSIYLDIGNSHWPQGESVGDRPDIGGASGGPVFRFRTEPIEMLELAGIIYESSQDYELVFGRHAYLIGVDGEL